MTTASAQPQIDGGKSHGPARGASPVSQPSRTRPPLPPGPYLVAGVGRAGMAAARALRALPGEPVLAWDGLDGPAQDAAIAILHDKLGIRTVRGTGIELFETTDPPRTIVKSPGLAYDTPLLLSALRRGLAVIDEAELGWRLDARPTIGVTGTNGKSTTTSLLASILAADGRRPVCAGNTRFGTPLCAASDEPGDILVAELSSFQLEGCPRLCPDAAVFTNLTRDHLYRHGSRAAYFACKRRAFISDDGDHVAAAAIGVDQPEGRLLAAELRDRGATVVTFGQAPDADRRVIEVEAVLTGPRILITEGKSTRLLSIRLAGWHNALNVAAALALADALGMDPGRAADAIERAAPLPGRFELVSGGRNFDVIVDFAHNPDGVARALEGASAVLRARRAGQLRVVLSTMSFVDAEQARATGAAAAAAADHVILTTQRFRLEDPAGAIHPGLRLGAVGAAMIAIEPDRRRAIARALCGARPGDIVLILDRGESAGLVFDPDDVPRPLDDRAEVRKLLTATRV